MDALDLVSVACALVPPGKGIPSAVESLTTGLVAAGQRALHHRAHRARCNGAARDGRYMPELERAIT